MKEINSHRRPTMKKVALKDVKPYQAPKHFNMTALRLHGKEETGAQRFWMGLSHFLPGGGAEYDASPLEKIYFVLEGEVAVKTSSETVVLGPWDSLYIGPNEGREIINQTNRPASMLVVINYPD
jgi:quercetin dioxygenase-like cupin family protein